MQASRLALLRGDVESGAALLAHAEEKIENSDSLQFLRLLAQCHAQLALARDDFGAVEDIAAQVLTFPPTASALLPDPQVARLAVESTLAGGTVRERARAILDGLRRQREPALEQATGGTAGSVRRVGRLVDAEATRLGDPGPGVWRACLADLESVPDVDEELYLALRLAESLLLTDRTAEAAPILAEAHQRAVRLGSARVEALEATARRARVRLAGVPGDDGGHRLTTGSRLGSARC